MRQLKQKKKNPGIANTLMNRLQCNHSGVEKTVKDDF